MSPLVGGFLEGVVFALLFAAVAYSAMRKYMECDYGKQLREALSEAAEPHQNE